MPRRPSQPPLRISRPDPRTPRLLLPPRRGEHLNGGHESRSKLMIKKNIEYLAPTFEQVGDEGCLFSLFFLLLLLLGFLPLFFLLAGKVSTSEVPHELANILVPIVIHFHFSIAEGLVIRVGVRIITASSF